MDTTPVNRNIQQTQHEELDLQPSRGPREESIVNTIDQFLDENYEDVLRTSNIQTNFSISTSEKNVTGRPVLPLGWILPDGTNRTVEEIRDKKISNDHSPGGGQAGAVVMTFTTIRTVLRYTVFPSGSGNGRNVRIHPAAVEVNWIVMFQHTVRDQ